jgi:hypothetical protein
VALAHWLVPRLEGISSSSGKPEIKPRTCLKDDRRYALIGEALEKIVW